jgi:hypothetical protein
MKSFYEHTRCYWKSAIPNLARVKKKMANQDWEVKLINKGRTLTIVVPAHTQKEARETAERFYPDYKAMSAQRI